MHIGSFTSIGPPLYTGTDEILNVELRLRITHFENHVNHEPILHLESCNCRQSYLAANSASTMRYNDVCTPEILHRDEVQRPAW